MARDYSAKFKRTINRTSAPESPVLMLEISHAALVEPVRVVNDSDDFPYGAAHAFSGGAAYAEDDMVVPETYNGRFYVCTVAGTAAGTEPAWPTTIGATVTSGGATFRCEGVQFKAVQFRAALPDDKAKQMPRARLAIDNVGRELAAWIEASAGGEGATCRMIQALRSEPDVIEWEVTLDLRNVSMFTTEVTGDLGFDDILNRPAVALRYDPQTAPGLF